MDLEQLDLNPRIIAALKKARLMSVRQLLHFSGPDLQRLTGLSDPDIRHLLRAAASQLRGSSGFTALQLFQQRERFPAQHRRLSLGCPVLDAVLGGGLPLEGVTELAGISSAGKTQLALQLCLAVQFPLRHGGLEAGSVYICTEDAFPSRRLQQLIRQQRQLRTDVPGDVVDGIRFGDQIFIEHVADVDALLACVGRKVPLLLSRGLARLVVLDSVAAPFRCEFASEAAATRAQHLRSLGAALRRLSCAFRSPVLCVNQVRVPVPPTPVLGGRGRVQPASSSYWNLPGHRGCGGPGCDAGGSRVSGTSWAGCGRCGAGLPLPPLTLFPASPRDERLCPALGLAWADQLLMRLMVHRRPEGEAGPGPPGRTLRVVFAPHLPPSSCSYTISAEGVRGTPGTEAH
ncbi:DNA repair protein XRCC3 isoform X2 [Erinaceus europaeus]|uniref:DNA repair protein XRCC3 isoform X2 n=1 Tax=Erinaceus europaeus TaxID=9365 RepID=A0A1S3W5E8_ERIEU|nr:DNA repair protein XRCC3 isoform X2 [Erinaceus europaeus]